MHDVLNIKDYGDDLYFVRVANRNHDRVVRLRRERRRKRLGLAVKAGAILSVLGLLAAVL